VSSCNGQTNTADSEPHIGILEKTLGVFEVRLACVPLEYGMKLRDWKEIVARVHSDFAAKVPEAELPTLVTGQNLRTAVPKDRSTRI